MRKKFLSALMLGLLTLGTTSTITSCKDYDGDISSLKDQIKSLEDLVAQKEATINSSISNLQSAIDKANNEHATKAALEEAKDILAAAIEQESSERKNADADLVKADAELSAAIAKAQAAADAAAKVAATNTESIQKVADDLASTKKNLNTLSENLTKAEGEIGELQAALAAQIIVCDSANSALTQEVKDLKAYVDTQDAALKTALEAEIAGVQSSLSAKEQADYNELKDLHDKNAQNITELQSKMDVLYNTTIPNIEKRLGNLDILTAALSKDLTSLVFVPDLYVDGIETYEYKFVKDTALLYKDITAFERVRQVVMRRTEDGAPVYGTQTQMIEGVTDYQRVESASAALANEYVYGPTWPITYHLNPSNANPNYADVKGFACRTVDVVTRSTDGLIITSPEYYDNFNNGVKSKTSVFGVKDGLVTVGIKIANPKLLLYNWPEMWKDGETDGLYGYTERVVNAASESQTGDRSEGKENIIALQIARHDTAGVAQADKYITSDYAMLQPEVLHPEGIVWVKKNARGDVNTVDEAGSHSWVFAPWVPCNPENYGSYNKKDTKQMHVWDSPVEALTHTDKTKFTSDDDPSTIGPSDADDYGTPDILLPYNDETGITLSNYIGTHVLNECPLFKTSNAAHNWLNTWNFGEEQEWGLHYEFELIEYQIDGNSTIDSRYCTIDKNTGKIVARDVKIDGTTDTSHTADKNNNSIIGREPLVRVMLKTADGKVLLDGYILVRITKAVDPKGTKEIDYAEWNVNFDLCNATDLMDKATSWSVFDVKVLDELDIEKTMFDKLYELDVRTDWTSIHQDNGGEIYSAKVFKKVGDKYVQDMYTDAKGHSTWFGNVLYYRNVSNVTNHAFSPDYTEDEMEYITHEQDPGTKISRDVYVRFVAKDYTATYKYIYLKLKVNFVRNEVAKTGIKTKNENYWYSKTGDNDGYDAIVFNTTEPLNSSTSEPTAEGYNIDTKWSNNILKTFVQNNIGFTNPNFTGDYLKLDAGNVYSYRKFYFAPINTEIKDIHGNYWIITSRSPDDVDNVDKKGNGQWNSFVCHGNICCADDHKEPNTPLGYNHNNHEYDYKAQYNKGYSEYRAPGMTGGYVTDCTSNLHSMTWDDSKKTTPYDSMYLEHKFIVDNATEATVDKSWTINGEASWKENSATLKRCAIDYNDGVFTNNELYAYNETTKKFTLIATLNQRTGEVYLVRSITSGKTTPNSKTDNLYSEPLDMVLNAIGYWGENNKYYPNGDKHENISDELHTHVGVVVNNGCGVAVNMFDKETNDNVQNRTLFQTSWQRPINVVTVSKDVWDADNNGDGKSILDIINMFDWRGPSYGDMESMKWLYGYYNVYAIKFDVNPANVITTMHKTVNVNDPSFDPTDTSKYWPLSSASNKVHLWVADSYNAVKDQYNYRTDIWDWTGYCDYTPYASHEKNNAAKLYTQNKRDTFGYIYYENNGDNVTDFYVGIPIEICYEWGHLDTYVFVKIHATEGNQGAKATRK